MILLVDNYDSFTYNLVDYFQQLNVEVDVLRNDQPFDKFFEKEYSGVVLSPGPETPETAGQLLKIAKSFVGKTPILGICLGHQALGMLQGAKLTKAIRPMHGKLSAIRTEEGIVFSGLPETFNVVRYHSLVLKDLPEGFKITAKTVEKEIMAMESEALMLSGIQFHPEAVLTEYGIEMLRNWASFYNIV